MNLFHSTIPVHTHSDHNEAPKKKKRKEKDTEDLPLQQPVHQPSDKERKKRKHHETRGTKDTKE